MIWTLILTEGALAAFAGLEKASAAWEAYCRVKVVRIGRWARMETAARRIEAVRRAIVSIGCQG